MKEAEHSRLVDGSFNKRENLHTRLVLGATKPVISAPAHQNLKSLYKGP